MEFGSSKKESERVEVEEMTTEVLDNLLVELMRTGCENKMEEGTKGDSRPASERKNRGKEAKESKDQRLVMVSSMVHALLSVRTV